MQIDNNQHQYVFDIQNPNSVDLKVSGLEMASPREMPSCEPVEGVKYPVKVEYCPNCHIPFEVELAQFGLACTWKY